MGSQKEIPETKPGDYGPDEQGFLRALVAEIAARYSAATNPVKPIKVESVVTPVGASDAVKPYGSE